ncbi:MAG: glycosyltransferase [Gallionella sp.]
MPTTTSTIDFASQNSTEQPLAVFTICSKNFTAYAKTLFDSVREFHPEAEQYMCLCDEVDSGYDPATLPFNTILLRELDIPGLEGMAERYNITEFNTAIKPFAFAYLFKKLGKRNVVYIDPDIMLTSRMEEVVAAFSTGAECILTPHILRPAENVEIHDQKMLIFGIYNLGFIALHHSEKVIEIVEWWGRRLQFDCVIRIEEGLFVDQKWADLFPAFIPETVVLHHEGYNVAYWNLSQRQIKRVDGQWYANEQLLRFVHFSGNKLDDESVFSRHAGTFNRDNIGELRDLLDEYRKRVYGNGHKTYLKLPYSFNWNGASGINLHTPKPKFQESVVDQVLASPEKSGFRRPKPAWIAVVLAAREISGGWLPLTSRTAKILFTEGVPAIKRRINFAKIKAKVITQNYQATSGIKDVVGRKLVNPLPKIFVTDWSTPRPDQDAGSVSTFYLLKILVELGYDVTFVPSDLAYLGEYTDALQRTGVRCLHQKDIGSIHEYLKEFGAIYSAFILYRAPIAALFLADIRKYAPCAVVILETVDLHYLREMRAAEKIGTPEAMESALRAKDLELSIIAGCDVAIVLSSFEESLLAHELPDVDIRTLPLLFLDMHGPSDQGFEQRKDMVFIGGFRHLPNIDAVTYFCREIWPLVHTRLPHAQFFIIGSHPPPEVLALGELPGVKVLGYVKNIDPIFASIRLSVAPLQYGAGIKGKIVTSLGHGVPVVGTSIAVEGMNLQEGEHILIADNAGAFAEAVLRVYTDTELWNRLSSGGVKRADELYSEHAGRLRIKRLMDSLELKSSDFEFYRIASYDDYKRHTCRMASEFLRRSQIELELIQRDVDCFYIEGYCAVCGEYTQFQVGFMYSYQNMADGHPIPNWREHLNCIKCGYTNRIRYILHFLKNVVRPHSDNRFYITEQTTPLFKKLQSDYPHLIGSEYLGDNIPPGQYRGGLRNEDLTRLSFAEASFDVILSLDVMEHVPDDFAAISECYRCLAPGGTLVFTAPYHLDKYDNTVRAQMNADGTVEHLVLPPEYHGNPVDPENGALCFRYFGWEVLDKLKSVGFSDVHVVGLWSRDLAYLGGEQIIFVATKPANKALTTQ